MKTQLPDKYTNPGEDIEIAFNQLIDYLTELTAVVEEHRQRHIEDIMLLRNPVAEGNTPTLKEQLLGEIAKVAFFTTFDEEVLYRHDVEAIINHLIK